MKKPEARILFACFAMLGQIQADAYMQAAGAFDEEDEPDEDDETVPALLFDALVAQLTGQEGPPGAIDPKAVAQSSWLLAEHMVSEAPAGQFEEGT